MTLLDTLVANPAFAICFSGVLGLIVGSFLNVVILRLPPLMEWTWRQEAHEILAEGQENPEAKLKPPGIVREPSHCPCCERALKWWHNVPLVSFLALRGRCGSCKAPISWQYPLVEAATALLFVMCTALFGVSLYAITAWVFCALLLALAAIDARTTWLPDSLVFPLLWLGLAVAALELPGAIAPAQAIGGAMAGYLSLWGANWLFRLIRKKEGMGYGDFKLLAALGAWCGPAAILPIVLVSTVFGATIGGLWLARRSQSASQPFAFGPFLVAAGFVEFFWRTGILRTLGMT